MAQKRRYLLLLAILLMAWACMGTTCSPSADGSLTVTEPMMVAGPNGLMVPVLDANNQPIMRTSTVPADQVPAWAQVQLAKERHPYVEQELDGQGRITKQTIWGGNGATTYQDVDSDFVKFWRTVMPGAASVGTAGIMTWGQYKTGQAMWGALPGMVNGGGRQPATVDVHDGGAYVFGNNNGLQFNLQQWYQSQNPVTYGGQ